VFQQKMTSIVFLEPRTKEMEVSAIWLGDFTNTNILLVLVNHVTDARSQMLSSSVSMCLG